VAEAWRGNFVTVRFYNGVGQLLQVQQAQVTLEDDACSQDGDTNPDLCDVIVDYFYDSNGRLFKQSVPYPVLAGLGYRTPDPGQPFTQTTYDNLGRTDTVTAPDTAAQSYEYGIQNWGQQYYRRTLVTDAEGHPTVTLADVFGQVWRVMPLTGPGLQYTYDTLGRLDEVGKYNQSDPGEVISTTIRYDLAGRKTSMTDPDMGVWSYGYDALSNLTHQEDANGQVTCLYYDTLNRLVGKYYTDSTPCPTGLDPYYYDVQYNYDEGGAPVYEIGRRTSMRDATGTTEWNYNTRGRVTSMTRIFGDPLYPNQFNHLDSYTFSDAYNDADQVETVTYPGGEQVTTGYNARGLPETLASDETYVAGAIYDYLARLTDLTRQQPAQPVWILCADNAGRAAAHAYCR
jgi:YD repeat-containing protein